MYFVDSGIPAVPTCAYIAYISNVIDVLTYVSTNVSTYAFISDFAIVMEVVLLFSFVICS